MAFSLKDSLIQSGKGGGGEFGKKTSSKIRDPLNISPNKFLDDKKPKKPEKTAEQDALERRTRSLLDKEIGDSEDKLKALARGSLGSRSLLAGAPTTANQASSGIKQNKQGGTVSMLGRGR
ncbi:hypothetical protein [Pseudoalteromonas marina]|uniref:hypothetical protein n=1 Tax=Pseudoalteromonas marina TaxID=267375 RepID=UPI003C549F43